MPTVLGGAVEKTQLQLAEAYAAAGHDVTMISRQFDSFPKEEIVSGVRHIRIPAFDRGQVFAMNLVRDWGYSSRAAKAMPISDITVTNGFSLPMLVSRKKAGRIYVNVNRFPKGQLLLYRKADRFQAVSTIVADAIVKQVPAYAGKVVVIGNPVPQRYFTNKPKKPTVLFVGRLAREKGIHQLIQAFGAMAKKAGFSPEWKLRIVGPHAFEHGGDGIQYLNELKRLAAPMETRCQFVGPVFNEEALIAEYASAAIFVYPTVASKGEALPVAPLEAMAAGCAVVVSKLSCFDDYIRDGVNALQFDHTQEGAANQLAGLLMTLIENIDSRQRLASAGREKAEEFCLPVIAHKMLQDFDGLFRLNNVVSQ